MGDDEIEYVVGYYDYAGVYNEVTVMAYDRTSARITALEDYRDIDEIVSIEEA